MEDNRKVLVDSEGRFVLNGHRYELDKSSRFRDAFVAELEDKILAGDSDDETTSISAKKVVGLVVAVQHADGTIYPHMVGAIDYLRAAGVLTLELSAEAARIRERLWIDPARPAAVGPERKKLEEGY